MEKELTMDEIFEEKHYLNGEEVCIKFFKALHEKKENIAQQEQEKFKDVLVKYDVFLSKVADFIKSLELKSSLETSLAISYLIKEGYLSQCQSFRKMVVPQSYELTSCYGINIVEGIGCCRNVVDFHKDVMQKLETNIKKLYGTCCETDDKGANHVISGLLYDDNLYGLDLANDNNLFHYEDVLILTEITTKKTPRKIQYRPYYEMVKEGISLEKVQEELRKNEEYSKKRIIEADIYENDLKPNTIKFMNNQEKQIKDFHDKTKILKREIVNEIYDKIL